MKLHEKKKKKTTSTPSKHNRTKVTLAGNQPHQPNQPTPKQVFSPEVSRSK